MLAYLPSLLTVAFIVLKLTNHIDWSWWWVLSPAWGTLAFVLLAFMLQFIVVIMHAHSARKRYGR